MFNFFTSFGYFKTQHEHNEVIRNISDSLKKQGTLVLDYINVRYAEKRLVASEEKEIDGIVYSITRWMDDKCFYKKIEIDEGQSGEPFENVEQVARFTLDDFNRMFACNALKIQEGYGDYRLGSFDPESSPRLIMIVKKAFSLASGN